MDVRRSAFKHGVATEAIVHAIAHYQFRDDDMFGTEPPKILILGPDPAGNILEIIAITDADEVLVVFRAMPCRTAYLRLLSP